jgi:hypothetical protein
VKRGESGPEISEKAPEEKGGGRPVSTHSNGSKSWESCFSNVGRAW